MLENYVRPRRKFGAQVNMYNKSLPSRLALLPHFSPPRSLSLPQLSAISFSIYLSLSLPLKAIKRFFA